MNKSLHTNTPPETLGEVVSLKLFFLLPLKNKSGNLTYLLALIS